MKVLICHRGYWPAIAGAELMAVQTAAALADRGHGVRLARLAATRPAELEPPPSVARVELGDPAELEAACADFRPDVVHAVDLVGVEFAAAAAQLARRRGALLALTPASAPQCWEDPATAAALCSAAAVVFVLSGAERSGLAAIGVAAARLRSIPQAPALRGGGDPGRFRGHHGLGEEVVLFLGRRARAKGYRELLEAAPLVWRQAPGAAFVFAGAAVDADCEEFFRRRRDPRVIDLGVVSAAEKEDALAACSVLCLPTSADVSPLVFAEAWSYGKPVLSGRFPGAEEVIRDRRDGILVEPRPSTIAAGLRRLLAEPRLGEELGRSGRRRVAREMSWTRVASAVESGYVEAAAGRLVAPPTPGT